MVMHGSSSVPEELVAMVNKYGGKMPNAKGVPMSEIQKVIPAGVRKVNIDTDGRIAITGAIRKVFVENPEQVRSARLPQARPRGPGQAGGAEDARPGHRRQRRHLPAQEPG